MKVNLSKAAIKRLRLVAKFGNQTLSETILYFVPEDYAKYPGDKT